MVTTDYNALQKKIREVIEKNNLSGKGLQDILKSLEGKVSVIDVNTKDIIGEPCSGFIYKTGEKFYIGVEESDFALRKRFTVAHELGHYFLHGEEFKDKDVIVDNVMFRPHDGVLKEKDLKEQEANEFAAEILMPHEKFTKSVNSMKINLGNIYEDVLSFDYQVSVPAVKYRIKNLGL